MDYSKLRQKIFSKYAENLNLFCKSQNRVIAYEENDELKPIEGLFYACPLCLTLYNSLGLDQTTSNPLTLEDVPPQSVGGKRIILTCKKCNNKSGTVLDKHLTIGLENAHFFSTGCKIDGKLGINDGKRFKSAFAFNQEKKELILYFDESNPYAKEQITESIKHWDGGKISFRFPAPNKRKHDIALLKTAYLLAFRYFGYDYIFTKGAMLIRDQIVNPKADIINNPLIFLHDSLEGKEGIHWIHQPKDLKAILVVFKLKINEIIKSYGVCLPGPDTSHTQSYLDFKGDQNFECSFTPLSDINFFDYAGRYYELWT